MHEIEETIEDIKNYAVNLYDVCIIPVKRNDIVGDGGTGYTTFDGAPISVMGDNYYSLRPIMTPEPRYTQVFTEHNDMSSQKGGMGHVMKVEDTKTGAFYAAKMQTVWINNYMTEGLIAAQFNHPNVISSHGFGIKGIPVPSRYDLYSLYPWVDGVHMGHWMQEGVGLDGIVRVVDQVARGVMHINDKGYVYCDLKPANVMVDTDQNASIIDFGVSISLENIEFTSPILIKTCTFGYSPPEKRLGEVSLQTDVFSFGALVYESLVQERVYPTHIQEPWMRRYHPPAIARHEFINAHDALLPVNYLYRENFDKYPEVAEELSYILRKAMAKDLDIRYASVREMYKELLPVLMYLCDL